jgi:hypothetical protein
VVDVELLVATLEAVETEVPADAASVTAVSLE